MSLNGQHVVKIGDSIRKNQKSNLMTFRYDFLPGSVATNKPGEVKVESDSSVSVKLPNQPGSNPDYTLYKGTCKEAVKECVLIVNRMTGQMVLEKIDYNVNLKNCRIATNNQSNNNPNLAISKSKINEDNKLIDNSDNIVDSNEITNDNRFENSNNHKKSLESMKGVNNTSNNNQTFIDPLFGDYNQSDNRNLSDSDDDLPPMRHDSNHPGQIVYRNDSDVDSDIEDEKQNDVTAQVAEDLQITDSSSSNSDCSSSDSEMNS